MRRQLIACGVATLTLALGLTPGLAGAGQAAAPQDATGPSSTVGEAPSNPSAYQHVTDYDFSRCTTQVADATRAGATTTGNVLDTGTFGGDPAGFSGATDYNTPKSYSGSMTTVWDSAADPIGTGKYLGAAPWATAVDQGTATSPTRDVSVVSTHNADSGGATVDYIHSHSADSGSSWGSNDGGATQAQFGTQLRDGRVLTIGFKYLSGNPVDGVSGTVTDSTGAPASAAPVHVYFRKLNTLTYLGGFRVTGTPVQLADGTVLQAVYGTQPSPTDPSKPGTHSITILTEATPTAVGSSDDWVFTPVRPDMGSDPSSSNPATTFGVNDLNYNYTEMGIAQRADGSLIGVIRELQAGVNAGYKGPLQWTSSTDGGDTWTPMQDATGTLRGGGTFDDGTTHPLYGIAPTLTLLPSGLIALSAGNNDSYIAYSADGGPGNWTGAYTYRNCAQHAADPSFYYFDLSAAGTPRAGVDPLQWRYGSSGNTSLVTDGAGQLLQYGDNCQNYSWGCVRTDDKNEAYAYSDAAPTAGCPPPNDGSTQYPCQSPYTVDLTSRIWQRRISLVGPNTGKLDLAAMYRRDPSIVSGNMTWTSSAHPRAGAAGAFDGSTSYWSSAVANGGAGTMTIDLGRTYNLNRVGVSLRPQLAESATVQTSPDGTTWTTVYSPSNVTSRALSYQSIAQAARYVRVNVDASGGCDTGLASSCAFLNELELYSTVDGFENDTVNNQPRGSLPCPYTDATRCQATVVDNPAASVQPGQNPDTSDYSHHVVLLNDQSDQALAQVSFPESPLANPTLHLRMRQQAVSSDSSGGTLIKLTDRGSGAGYELWVSKDGRVHNYVGGAWRTVPVTPAVPFGYWCTLTVQRTASGATVAVAGGKPAAIAPMTTAPASLDTATFLSTGTAYKGDIAMVDDVEWR